MFTIPKKFSPIVREVSEGYDIDKVYADKAHDNRRSFNLLDNLNIEPAIQIRKNASIAATVAQRSPMFMFTLKIISHHRKKVRINIIASISSWPSLLRISFDSETTSLCLSAKLRPLSSGLCLGVTSTLMQVVAAQ
jgi:hypothetical protein